MKPTFPPHSFNNGFDMGGNTAAPPGSHTYGVSSFSPYAMNTYVSPMTEKHQASFAYSPYDDMYRVGHMQPSDGFALMQGSAQWNLMCWGLGNLVAMMAKK